MKEIKNIDLIDKFIYSFEYNLLMKNVLIKIKEDNIDLSFHTKYYEIRLGMVSQIEYKVFEKAFGVAKIKDIKIKEEKYIDKISKDEKEVYNLRIKIWEDELNIKCKDLYIELVYEE